MVRQQPLSYGQVHRSLVGLFDGDMHAKRIASLANATLGVVKTGSLAVSTIGHGLALARGLTSKHAIKQVDRLLSNEGIDIDAALCHWVRYVVGPRTSINVAMDWTEFDADGQATLMLSLLTSHGRATPLLWLTVDTSTLKNHRNEYEYQVLVRLADALPSDIKVCIVADRGFGDQKLYRVLSEELKFDYVIRFRGNIQVTAADGEMRTAAAWVGPGGRARVLRDALVTAECYQVGSVLCVQDKAMKQAWCLATSGTGRASEHGMLENPGRTTHDRIRGEDRGSHRRWQRNGPRVGPPAGGGSLQRRYVRCLADRPVGNAKALRGGGIAARAARHDAHRRCRRKVAGRAVSR